MEIGSSTCGDVKAEKRQSWLPSPATPQLFLLLMVLGGAIAVLIVKGPWLSAVDAPSSYKHDRSFPGSDDNTTLVQTCPARLIVELEKSYSRGIALPFSPLLLDFQHLGNIYIENYPGGCGLNKAFDDDGDHFPTLTIPQWLDQCLTDNSDWMDELYRKYGLKPDEMLSFAFYYDGCPADLVWNNFPCKKMIANQNSEIVQTIPLLNGSSFGQVMLGSENKARIILPDPARLDVCWGILCDKGNMDVSMDECINYAQAHLRQVSLEEFVDTIKKVNCV